ncbi:FecR domain-containing protein [Flagellimonas sp. HMM57]|uniref:FecR family protein n=1 Tax=unclassified Flagellimonas TaxID=2644544 RepID=UPI0013D83B6E|nr:MULTISPECIES: FecR family protein [unclassified Flagellimonas]UII76773.1 FecR domain-containing protein [Flagellimonas sp. HMM57]
MFEDKNDTILAKWLAGELTAEEQGEFENDPEFLEYQQIVQGMNQFKKPSFDTASLKSKVMAKIDERPKGKVIRLRPLYYAVGVAASIVLIIGIFFNEVSYATAYGEQLVVTLPDGSTVQLNAGTTIAHNRFFWKNNKTVNLKGEAFFKVEKGDGFKVETQSGTVSVLGTEFNVRARTSNFSLTCYEGKVRFESPNAEKEAILKQGDAIDIDGNGVIKAKKIQSAFPSWTKGSSAFSNADLSEVIKELEAQYGITIQYGTTNNGDGFTGSFVHDNLEIALKTVFVPMGIAYEISEDQKKVLLNTQ